MYVCVCVGVDDCNEEDTTAIAVDVVERDVEQRKRSVCVWEFVGPTPVFACWLLIEPEVSKKRREKKQTDRKCGQINSQNINKQKIN